MPKYLDDNGLLYFWQKIKAKFVSNVAYDSTNKKLTKTVNGSTSDIVTVGMIKSAMNLSKSDVGLGNVDNTADSSKSVLSAAKLTTARKIDGVSFNGSADIIHYGECTTSATIGEKVVSCTGFNLVTGAIILAKFTVTNTASVSSLTLNVNSTGAKSIKYRNGYLASPGILSENRIYCFVYDGTSYQLVGDLDTNTTYSSMSQSEADTGTATTGRLLSASVLDAKIWNEIAKVTYAVTATETKQTVSVTDEADTSLTSFDVVAATTSAAGLMSAADKTKLDGIAAGANAYTHPTYTARTGKPTANATPGFGSTFTVSQITSDTSGHVTGATDRTITIPNAAATTSAAGLMSAADKTKLDGIATGANAYTHPTYTARTGKPTANATPAFGGTVTVSQITSDSTGHVTGATDRTITIPSSAATTSAAGLMSAADKTKLDGIAEGAEAVSVTTSGSGNVVSAISESGGAITVTKGVTALTSHQTIKQDGVTGATINRYARCTTEAATAAKTVNITTGSVPSLVSGLRISVFFVNANTAANPTLSVNGKDAKPIWVNSSSSFDKGLISGPLDLVYDGDASAWLVVGGIVSNISSSGSGNVVTGITYTASTGAITYTKGSTAILSSARGAANGVCPLNANSVIDSQYLPSYVDDIIEAYPVSGATELAAGWLSATSGGSALTPETGKIYVLMADTTSYGTNTQFRWSGSAYVKLNDGGVSAITNAEIDTIVAA